MEREPASPPDVVRLVYTPWSLSSHRYQIRNRERQTRHYHTTGRTKRSEAIRRGRKGSGQGLLSTSSIRQNFVGSAPAQR